MAASSSSGLGHYARLLGGYTVRLGPMRDLRELARSLGRGRRDVLFACTSPIDEQWIRTTLAECRRRGLRCDSVLATFRMPPQSARSRFDFAVSPLALRLMRARVLVTPSTGLLRSLRPRGCRHFIHMPHSLVSLHGVYPEGTFDRYDAVFCCGPHHRREAARMDELAGRTRRHHEVGYGRMDVLRAEFAAWAEGRTADAAAGPTVVIAPSWGPGHVLEKCGEALVGGFLDGGFRAIVRPHPMVVAQQGPLLDGLRERFGGQATFRLELPDETSASLFEADVMVSDYSGAAFEFALLRRRPVVFVDGPPRNLNPAWQQLGLELMEVTARECVGRIVPPEAAEIVAATEELLADVTAWAKHIDRFSAEYVYHAEACAPAAAEAIESLLARSGNVAH
jgi:hypothetical protein